MRLYYELEIENGKDFILSDIIFGKDDGDEVRITGLEIDSSTYEENNKILVSGRWKGVSLEGNGIDEEINSIDVLKENIENYKNTLDNFLIRYADRVKEYGFLGGHFIQENGCDDTKQEDYLSNQSTYFNPLSLQVVKDMSELCAKILMGEYDNEMTQDEYSWSYGSARISGHFS